MKDIVNKYLEKMRNDPNHRFKSWEHCYKAFEDQTKSHDELALHLAFYLASWGMYRGSCDSLQKDYKVHTEIVEYIKPKVLQRDSMAQLEDIKKVMDDIATIYCKNGINATETLQTKVLLGTLGCLPAFDNFFIEGWRLEHSRKKPTIEDVLKFAEKEAKDIEECQRMIDRGSYPPMKVVDMYFWQLGYDESQKNKLKKAAQ